MYINALVQAGLNENEAKIYEILLQEGAMKGSQVSSKSGLKRGITYKILHDLSLRGLVERVDEPGKVSLFRPQHPITLNELMQKKETRIREKQQALEHELQNANAIIKGALPNLISDFNLLMGRPGVQVYEGTEGIRKVGFDSLTAKTEIYSYIDNEAVVKYIPEINEGYLALRKKRNIKKKMIGIDSKFVRDRAKSFDPNITQMKVIPKSEFDFSTVMQIYDNKTSYVTIHPKIKIGVIIENEFITNMHRMLFEYTWKTAQTIPIGVFK